MKVGRVTQMRQLRSWRARELSHMRKVAAARCSNRAHRSKVRSPAGKLALAVAELAVPFSNGPVLAWGRGKVAPPQAPQARSGCKMRRAGT